MNRNLYNIPLLIFQKDLRNVVITVQLHKNIERFLTIITFTLIALACKAQTGPYDTIPYVPEYYAKRVALFKTEPMVTGKIIFLGNSITQFGNWKKLLNDSTIINRGIAGDITFGVLNRLDEVIDHQPSKLFIKIGINDIAKNIPDEVITKNIFSIIQRVKKGSPKTQVFVHSILPTNDLVKEEYPDAFGKNEHVIMINTELADNAKRIGFTFINLVTKFQDNKGKLNKRYDVGDGLHLNDLGYELWIDILKKGKYL